MQVTGPLNDDIASNIQKMANIQYKLGDLLTAVELMTKSIIIKEKVLGFDHPQVAYSYSNLGLYYHTAKYFRKGFECMMKSLNILQNCAGYNHPDISNIFMNLGMMYQDADKLDESLECYLETLKRKILLHGESHLNISSTHQAIAHVHYVMEDFKNALVHQEKSHLIAKALLPEESEYIINSKNTLNKYMQLSIAKEKMKASDKGNREFGSNPKH